MCYPARSGRSQFHGMRKKMHDCHTGDDETKAYHGRHIQLLVKEEPAHQGDDDHADAGPERIRDPHRHIFDHVRQQLKGQDVPGDA